MAFNVHLKVLPCLLALISIACSQRLCEDGKPQVMCIMNPCQFGKCPGVQGTVCRANYCGGCNANFYFQGVKLTQADCQNGLSATTKEAINRQSVGGNTNRPTMTNKKPNQVNVCEDGRPQVMCIMNPCQFGKCPGVQGTVCRANYCGGCNAHFYFQGVKLTQADCQNGLSATTKEAINRLGTGGNTNKPTMTNKKPNQVNDSRFNRNGAFDLQNLRTFEPRLVTQPPVIPRRWPANPPTRKPDTFGRFPPRDDYMKRLQDYFQQYLMSMFRRM